MTEDELKKMKLEKELTVEKRKYLEAERKRLEAEARNLQMREQAKKEEFNIFLEAWKKYAIEPVFTPLLLDKKLTLKEMAGHILGGPAKELEAKEKEEGEK